MAQSTLDSAGISVPGFGAAQPAASGPAPIAPEPTTYLQVEGMVTAEVLEDDQEFAEVSRDTQAWLELSPDQENCRWVGPECTIYLCIGMMKRAAHCCFFQVARVGRCLSTSKRCDIPHHYEEEMRSQKLSSWPVIATPLASTYKSCFLHMICQLAIAKGKSLNGL